MIDSDVVGCARGVFVVVVVGGREGSEEDTAAGEEVVSGEGVERREGRVGVNDGEEAVVRGINGDAEEGCVGGESIVGDEGFDDAGVGDGGDDALAEGTDEEMLSAWLPREGFGVEIG